VNGSHFLSASLLALSPMLACSSPALPSAIDTPMVLGISTHFDQGWSLDWLDQVSALGATTIRDDLPWAKGEPTPGQYDFDSDSVRYIKVACERGIDVLLMVTPLNPAYDDGQTAHSPAAQTAYGLYLAALLDHFGDRCVRAIEVGNEVNADGLKLPDGSNGPRIYAALLAAVSREVKPRHPGVAILGGSTNVIGTGFLASIFQEGGLAHMDGVVVHPYRDQPDGLDIELQRLRAAMARAGGAKPIWATEYGSQFDDQRAAPAFLIQATTMLSAAGVVQAYWYDLVDEPAYRNMGLFTPDRTLKPAGNAARAALRLLLPYGRATRVNTDDRTIFVYRFGPDRLVLWGAPRPVRFEGDGRYLDSEGEAISPPDHLSEQPIIALGRVRFELGPREVLADSLHEFAGEPWSYLARRSDGDFVPLSMIDWTFTSYFGSPDLRPLELRADAGVAAGDGRNPLAATVRYTAPREEQAELSACLGKARDGAGLTVTISHGGKLIYTGVLDERLAIARQPVTLRRGETLDLSLAPRGDAGGNGFRYRMRLVQPGSNAGLICT